VNANRAARTIAVRVTTREPTIEETRIALTALASVVRRELG